MLKDTDGDPDVILIGTGAEVHECLAAAEELASKDGLNARVVSMPCWDRFAEADQAYRDQVLPPPASARGCRSRPRPPWGGRSGSATPARRWA